MQITVLGGGVSVAVLASRLASEPALASSEVVLHGRNATRLEVIAAHCHGMLEAGGGSAAAEGDLASALHGADVVVNMVRVGGAAARRHDEVNLRWREAPGDEGLGPGGVSNAWRTAPVITELVDAIRSVAPDATVMNLVAPLGVTTRQFQEAGLSCVGLCELPLVTRDHLTDAGAPPTEYVGSNHLGLHLPREPAQIAALAEAAGRASLAAEATVTELGGVPAPYYHRVLRPDLGEAVGIVAADGRALELSNMSDRVLEAMVSGDRAEAARLLSARPTPWFELSLVPALRARVMGTQVHLAVNTLNSTTVTSRRGVAVQDSGRGGVGGGTGRLVDWLPEDSVVELVGQWGPSGFAPHLPRRPTGRGLEYLTAVAAADRASSRAAEVRGTPALLDALSAWESIEPGRDPVGDVGGLSQMLGAVLEGGVIR